MSKTKFILLLISIMILLLILVMIIRNSNKQEINFCSGKYEDRAWEEDISKEDIGEVEIICILDRITAIEVSDIYFKHFQAQYSFEHAIAQSVFWDEEEKIWIVSYFPNQKNYVGMTCNIALSMQTGEVIKIWVRE